MFRRFTFVCLVLCVLCLNGCEGSGGQAGQATDASDIDDYLKDNPEAANLDVYDDVDAN